MALRTTSRLVQSTADQLGQSARLTGPTSYLTLRNTDPLPPNLLNSLSIRALHNSHGGGSERKPGPDDA
ncbi:hypothetical protein RRG08_024459 [Elysia crispata]|uniref:Uncharacterized protein n=1 Tax=Elysia crispata TaxID=231223 RepID=A0AAE0YP42_9GAST|nr:hypothetical protein RRG08_024459 [Elysia crispata]